MAASSLRAFQYLADLPEVTHQRLYTQPSTALAVFRRMLPHLAKTLVMAMLNLHDPLPEASMEQWIKSENRGELQIALDTLDRLHIIENTVSADRRRALRLNAAFANSLRLALTGGGEHRSFGVPCADKHDTQVTVDFLDAYARQKWEAILYYVVGSTGNANAGDRPDIAAGCRVLLSEGEFVEVKSKNVAIITQRGFEFLLQEVNVQVWTLLIVYLDQSEKLRMDSVDILSFLFVLGSLEVGQDYSTANLSETQKIMLDDLHDFGIIYRPSPTSTCFYPTRLATTLTSDSNALASTLSNVPGHSSSASDKGYIVIETNYRLYAYTDSPLRIRILALFTRLSTRYPNMVTGRVTKESIQSAISYGITADQIISYLTVHAHPVMISNASGGTANNVQQNPTTIPATVIDQIRLWQIEGERMKTTHGYLFTSFKDHAEYSDCVRYAEDVGVMVWKSDRRLQFFVTDYKQLQSFIANRTARSQSQQTTNGSTR